MYSNGVGGNTSDYPDQTVCRDRVGPVVRSVFGSKRRRVRRLSTYILGLISRILSAGRGGSRLGELGRRLVAQRGVGTGLLRCGTSKEVSSDRFVQVATSYSGRVGSVRGGVGTLGGASGARQRVGGRLTRVGAVLGTTRGRVSNRRVSETFISQCVDSVAICPSRRVAHFRVRLGTKAAIAGALRGLADHTNGGDGGVVGTCRRSVGWSWLVVTGQRSQYPPQGKRGGATPAATNTIAFLSLGHAGAFWCLPGTVGE